MTVDDVINHLSMIRAHIGNQDVVVFDGGDDYREPSFYEPCVSYDRNEKYVVIA